MVTTDVEGEMLLKEMMNSSILDLICSEEFIYVAFVCIIILIFVLIILNKIGIKVIK